jgi:hypothetical protein
MKPLKFWSASILVASALFLSGENNVKGATDDPQKARSESQQQHNTGEKIAPVPEQGRGPVPATYGSGNTYDYKGNFSYGPTYSAPPESRWTVAGNIASIASAVAVAIFTGFLVWLNLQLVGVTDEMKKATESVNRPFLFVADVRCPNGLKLAGGEPEVFYTYEFEIDLRNLGVGPADIFDYSAGAQAMDRDISVQPIVEPQIGYANVLGSRLGDPLIGPNETALARMRAIAMLTVKENDSVRRGEKAIAINGMIRYRGAGPEPYWTQFFWWCFLDAYTSPVNIQRALRADLNAHN